MTESKQGVEDAVREIREQFPNMATAVDKIMAYRNLAERRITELEAENARLREQTTSAGALREAVRRRLARIEAGDYSVIEMASDMEKLLAVQWSGLCYREGCQAGQLAESIQRDVSSTYPPHRPSPPDEIPANQHNGAA